MTDKTFGDMFRDIEDAFEEESKQAGLLKRWRYRRMLKKLREAHEQLPAPLMTMQISATSLDVASISRALAKAQAEQRRVR